MDTFLVGSGAPVSVAEVLARYHRSQPSAGEALLKPPGSAGGDGGGGVKGVASEEATLASIERAANAVLARVAAGNFNPYHDQLGRFTTRDGAVAPGDEAAAGASAFDKGGWGSGSGTQPPSDKVPSAQPAGSAGGTQGSLTLGPEWKGLGWGLHQPDFWDKVGSVLYPGYQAAKRHEAWLRARYGAPALSREVLQALPGLATEEYMRGYEQLGEKVDDPQAVQALQARYLAQVNGALRLHADVARTEKTIAKPALDAIEMMATAGRMEGLGALEGPALGAGLRSQREPAAITRSPEAAEAASGRVPEAPTMPAEPAPGRVPEVPGRPVEPALSKAPVTPAGPVESAFDGGKPSSMPGSVDRSSVIDAPGQTKSDAVHRVVPPGKPQFQLRKGEEGLSVFDASKVTPEEILRSFREGSTTVTKPVSEINGHGLILEPTPGDPMFPQNLQDAHMEIRHGTNMTHNQFKQTIKKLEPNEK